jgi:hypothetical protein
MLYIARSFACAGCGLSDEGVFFMRMNRRRALVILSSIGLGCRVMLGLARAQSPSDFDPVATAKLRAGEILREIAGSGRDASRPEPVHDELFNTGLLLQAGLRALLPVQERQGVALPGTPSPKDPKELILAQENYKAVFESGMAATAVQRATAIASIELATQQLERAGYTVLAKKVIDWLRTQR